MGTYTPPPLLGHAKGGAMEEAQVGQGNGETRMSIGELADSTGVSSRTIRYYEELGILPEPERSPGGTRRYSPEYAFYVEGALALKELGFTLEEIRLLGRVAQGRSMSKRERERAASIVSETSRRLEHKIRILNRLMTVLDDGSGQSEIGDLLVEVAGSFRNGEGDEEGR